MCCCPWGCKGSDTTERLNGTELKYLNNNSLLYMFYYQYFKFQLTLHILS